MLRHSFWLVFYWNAKLTVTFFGVKSIFRMKFQKYNIKKRMFRNHFQYFEISLKSVKSAHFNEICLQYF